VPRCGVTGRGDERVGASAGRRNHNTLKREEEGGGAREHQRRELLLVTHRSSCGDLHHFADVLQLPPQLLSPAAPPPSTTSRHAPARTRSASPGRPLALSSCCRLRAKCRELCCEEPSARGSDDDFLCPH
jgi:hypothetical protein